MSRPNALAREGWSRVAADNRLTPLFAPLDFLLASGGDSRLAVDRDTRLNGYGCRPYPRPEAFTFASSTATSVSTRAYARAAAAREALIAATIEDEDSFDAQIESLRMRLLAHLGLAGSGVEIVFSPSGTDAQLQASFLAQTLLGGPLASVVVAADETGSGTGFAIMGRHFNTSTALGHPVVKGEPVAGFAADTTRIDIAACDEAGRPRSLAAIDRDVLAAFARAIRDGRKVLLQTMDRSKLWRRAPSQACIAEIAARWPDAVQIVVDACQMRLSPERIRATLDRGQMVLITGSKFFTGPPFSGALLVPPAHAGALSGRVLVPHGLRDYTNRSDWPSRWMNLRSDLPDGFNAGQWLRWEAALAEIDAYFAVPEPFRMASLSRFSTAAARLIATGGLELLAEDPADSSDPIDDREFTSRTILPFILRARGAALSRDAAAGIYRALNRDVSERLPPGATAEEKAVAAQLCHIGQPVAVRDAAGAETAALRISAGARIVSESWCTDFARASRNLDGECDEVRRIVEKIRLLLRDQIVA